MSEDTILGTSDEGIMHDLRKIGTHITRTLTPKHTHIHILQLMLKRTSVNRKHLFIYFLPFLVTFLQVSVGQFSKTSYPMLWPLVFQVSSQNQSSMIPEIREAILLGRGTNI